MKYIAIDKDYLNPYNYIDYLNLYNDNEDLPTFKEFIYHLQSILSTNSIIVIAEHEGKIIGSAKLIIDLKLNKYLNAIGHIEDVVVKSSFRKQGIGQQLVNQLVGLARSKNCYKVILQCNDANVPFYEKSNFIIRGNNMEQFLR